MLNSALPGAPRSCAQFTHYCLGAFTVKRCMSSSCVARDWIRLLAGLLETCRLLWNKHWFKEGEGCSPSLPPPPSLLLFLIFALWSSFLKTSPLWLSPSHIFPTSTSSQNIRDALWLPSHERRKTAGKQSSVFVLHCPLWLWHFYALLPIAHTFCQHNISCYMSVNFCSCAARKIQ